VPGWAAPTPHGAAPPFPAAPAPPSWPTPPAQAPGWNGTSPFASPYAVPASGAFPAAPPARRSPAAGVIALVAGLLAAVGAPVVAAFAAFQVGRGTGWSSIGSIDSVTGLGFLSPVRDQVLVGELSFWIGTALGVWALVQGIVAIVTARGRVPAVIAVVVAALGPVIFFTVVAIAIGSGVEAYVAAS
jgi:hypothetical protein